jgi:hypothetical protein
MLADRFHLIADVSPGVVRLDFCFRLTTIRGYGSGVLRVSPSFAGSALHLVSKTLIGQLLVANCFSNALLRAPCYLFHFPGNLILVHGISPLPAIALALSCVGCVAVAPRIPVAEQNG